MIDFETWIAERLAQHAAEEAERNAPAALAYGALDTLREALTQLEPAERGDVVAEILALTGVEA